MPRSIGLPEIVVILLLAGLFLFPVWRIATKMGYPGPLGLFALFPGLNLILAYFHAFNEWPVLRELSALRQQPRG
ncbi:MAG TPA: hypothetical protein VN610_09130 [Bryobacteraceae bacterium]|nr:hypothetical protein [Bryobacteraceae bacterium]